MKATVTSANRNQKNSKGVDLIYKKDGEDRDFKIIDFSGKSKDLKPGDRIEINVEKDGNFWKITDLTKIHETPSVAPNSTPSVPFVGGQRNDPDQNKRIQRAVALKASVDLLVGMMQSGYLKKTANIDLINGLINEQCQMWESYLTLSSDTTCPTGEMREPGEEG